MNQINIRKAVIDDTPALMNLIRELAVFEKEPDAVRVSLATFQKSGFGKNPSWQAFVAEIKDADSGDSEIIGMALFYIRYSTWKGEMLYLEDIIVKEKFRGQGVGGLLMEQLKRFAQSSGYAGMIWQVLDWNERAINFYKKLPQVCFDESWVNVTLSF